ncbi:GDP-fucose protein O-fucosyltransferase protein [Actinidia chinensis var. chinensis]|uniref:O-fucosyltransferase family protein n=1 Tax=Actinidia chinensis var. chinensis TaxID=1590841 RepID=A0A2R6PY40_ACTCC|nr:GDP-fucose protein O-fucosyltransferase protein [Actinidia chinensis var. chinensis]
MGKQGSQRSPRPEYLNFELSLGAKESQVRCLKNDPTKFSACKGGGKRHVWLGKHVRSMVLTFGLMGFLFLLDSLLFSILDPPFSSNTRKSIETKEGRTANVNEGKVPVNMYDRLLNLASSALAEKEFQQDLTKFWEERYPKASIWRPCANRKSPTNPGKPKKSIGFILVSANGGLNQQRVAVCNAVAVASLLNATLVLPKFLYSNVWKDPSQFGDIYQEEHFMNNLKDEVNIVKELPSRLQSLDFEAIGSLITDADIPKEATPDDYAKIVFPLLLKNGVVHFLGFANRLGFDALPFELQRLRCKCNFHALKFVPKIRRVGSLLINRIRKSNAARNALDKQLLGTFMSNIPLKMNDAARGQSKYLALHLRFEVDMVAYSQCEFGGGEDERKELQAYRESHFPLLIERLKNSTPISPTELRKLGRCPLTPEEAGLVLAGLGFKRGTFIYLAGSHIYGGQSRMHPLTSLYPNLVTKEDLLTPSELAPFRNFSSQMAALDFIACATADVFAITDSGSQLSSLVSGFRTYYGGGHAPTLRPSKKRLAAILSKNSTVAWDSFEERIRKMIVESQRVRGRGYRRSIYRQPRCPACMCKYH